MLKPLKGKIKLPIVLFLCTLVVSYLIYSLSKRNIDEIDDNITDSTELVIEKFNEFQKELQPLKREEYLKKLESEFDKTEEEILQLLKFSEDNVGKINEVADVSYLSGDYKNSNNSLKVAMSENDPIAYFKAGCYSHNGENGFDQDWSAALEYYTKAATIEPGVAYACYNIATILTSNDQGIKADTARAIHWLEFGQSLAENECIYWINSWKLDGIYFEASKENVHDGFNWLLTASKRGHAKSSYKLYNLHKTGFQRQVSWKEEDSDAAWMAIVPKNLSMACYYLDKTYTQDDSWVNDNDIKECNYLVDMGQIREDKMSTSISFEKMKP